MLESPFEDIEIHVLELSINTCMFNELIEQMHFERSFDEFLFLQKKGFFGHKSEVSKFISWERIQSSSTMHQCYAQLSTFVESTRQDLQGLALIVTWEVGQIFE